MRPCPRSLPVCLWDKICDKTIRSSLSQGRMGRLRERRLKPGASWIQNNIDQQSSQHFTARPSIWGHLDFQQSSAIVLAARQRRGNRRPNMDSVNIFLGLHGKKRGNGRTDKAGRAAETGERTWGLRVRGHQAIRPPPTALTRNECNGHRWSLSWGCGQIHQVPVRRRRRRSGGGGGSTPWAARRATATSDSRLGLISCNAAAVIVRFILRAYQTLSSDADADDESSTLSDPCTASLAKHAGFWERHDFCHR